MKEHKIYKSVLITCETIVLCIVIIFAALTNTVDGVKSKASEGKKSQTTVNDTSNSDENKEEADVDENATTISYSETRITFSDTVEQKMASMTNEEKVAQLFLVSPENLTGVDNVTIAGRSSRLTIEQYPVGGVIYSSKNFLGGSQITALVSGVQGYSQDRIGLPLFVAVEEEGGVDYSPLATSNKYKITASANELGEAGDTEQVAQAVSARMAYITPFGFDMVLGTVANLSTGDDVSFDSRTYSSDASVASEMVTAEIAATESANVMSTLKYFPRIEDESDFDKITDEELSVFQAGINTGASVIMVSNATAFSITGDKNTPCTMAAGTVATLRGEMGFDGILLTAPMNEEAITGSYSAGETAVAAIVAGMDMIYEPADFVEAYDAVLAAVNDGTISEMRLENAVGRILSEKLD